MKLKGREAFEKYFKRKFAKFYQKSKFIPETTYIFAQVMANLQSGYVKYFNYKYERDGGLMKSRYFRELIESAEQLKSKVEIVHKCDESGKRSRIWTFRRKEVGFRLERIRNSVVRCSERCYSSRLISSGLKSFVRYTE